MRELVAGTSVREVLLLAFFPQQLARICNQLYHANYICCDIIYLIWCKPHSL